MPSPPSAIGSPGAVSRGRTRSAPRAPETGQEPLRSDFGEKRDRRDVERLLERAPGRHAALEGKVEVLRRVGAEADGAVVDDRLGMRDPGVEGERVDERLQRRAGRAERLRHVDRARAGEREGIGRADMRAHLAGRVVDDDDRRREPRPQPLDALARERLQRGLEGAVDREPVDAGIWRGADGVLRGMGREHRERAADRGHGLGPHPRGLGGSEKAARDGAGEHARARGAGGGGVAVRPARLGRLGERDEERGLRQVKPARLAAEIGERGRPQPLDVAAIGRAREIEVEDLVFAQSPLDLDRAHDLAELRGE